MPRPLELLLGGPATARPLLLLLKEAYRGRDRELTSEQEDAFRVLLVDAAAGRAYLPRYKGCDAGFVLVAFQHSVHHGGRIAVIADFYLSSAWQGLGLARRILRSVHQDLEAFGVPLAIAILRKDSPWAGVFADEGFACEPCLLFEKTFWIEEESGVCTF